MKQKAGKRVLWIVGILLAALLAASLAGCSGTAGNGPYTGPAPAAKPSVTEKPAVETPATEEPAAAPVTESGAGSGSTSSIQERLDRIRKKKQEQDAGSAVDAADTKPVEADPAEDDGPDMADPEGVARLGKLEGDMSLDYGSGTYMTNGVNIDEDHNPYDLTWRYGDHREFFDRKYSSRGEEWEGEWDDLYQSYVDACDWSLVFDADYYMATFPMLAELYHYDKPLLLEHYQTVGIHEGRAASAGFCPAVYAENCDPALRELFGEDWECYAFYYMLNYGTQRSVSAAGGPNDPTWLSLELSKTQAAELEHVNQYRAEVGADPVEPHPEMMALANFRAWNDAYHAIRAHDWLDTNEDDIYTYMEWMGMWKFSENTVKSWTANLPRLSSCWINYRNSPDHCEAMVRASQKTFGTSNCYWSAHTEHGCCSFDVYTEDVVPVNTLKEK